MKRKLKSLLATVLSAALLVTPLTAFGAETPADPAEAVVTETEAEENEAELTEAPVANGNAEEVAETEDAEDLSEETLTVTPNEGETENGGGTVTGNEGNETVTGNEGNETVTGNDSGSDEDPLNAEDGYTSIKMTAAVQKNNTIKVTWAPNAKLGYKSYMLYQRTADNKEWKALTPAAVTAKNYVDRSFADETEAASYLDVYRLDCFTDKTPDVKKPAATYITAAAPLFFTAETGDDHGEMTYLFSEMIGNAAVSYQFQIALKNKDKSDKVPDGYQDDWTTEISSADLYSFAKWPVNKTVSMSTLLETFSPENITLATGTTYYNRIRTAFQYQGKKYISAPSNVITYKYGPGSCYIWDIGGVKYDAKDPSGNRTRSQEYMDWWFEENSETVSENGGDEALLPPAEVILHKANISTEIKNGMVFVLVKEKEVSQIKSFDLMRSTTGLNNYKTLKNYKLTDKKNVWEVNSDYFKERGYKVFALHYTSFPPETLYYYKVRGVADKNARGGTGYWYEYAPTVDKVSEVMTLDASASGVDIYWKHDDCVKKYNVWKSNVEAKDMTDEQKKDLSYYHLLATAPNKTKKVSYGTQTEVLNYYIDKSVTAATLDKPYYYIIQPLVDVKKASDKTYNAEFCSDPVEGANTVALEKVAKLTAASAGLGKIKLTWKGKKNVPQYELLRTESAVLPDDRTGLWSYTFDVAKQGVKDTSVMNITDESAQLGVKYWYWIVPTSESATDIWSKEGLPTRSEPITSRPNAVTNLKATFRTLGQGANVSWTGNKADREALYYIDPSLTYMYEYTVDNGGVVPTKSTSFSDTGALAVGATRKYSVRVVIRDGSKTVCYSDWVSVNYTSRSGAITIYYGGQPYQSNTILLKLGQRADFSAVNGTNSAMSVVTTGGAGVAALQQSMSGNVLNFAFGGVAVGTQYFRIQSADGATRDLTVTVQP